MREEFIKILKEHGKLQGLDWLDLENIQMIDKLEMAATLNFIPPACITAKFIGKDSLGYKHGQIYQLYAYYHSSRISRLDGSDVCSYESLYSFLKNWQILSK